MLGLDSGDKIRGDASVANVVDYTLHGTNATTVLQLADGQLAAAIGDLYTAGANDIHVATITLVNTDSSARTVNLYLTPSGGTARRLIPKDLSLGAGFSLTFDGQKITVMDTSGNILTSINLASPTFSGTVTISSLTASEIVATNASKQLVSLAVATYPSLAELAYVKGVTSALQTQMNLKAPLISPSFTTPTLGAAVGTSLQLSGLTASEILGTDASKNLVSLAVATYPSLAELAYVKGVTSAIQTQLGLKAPLASPTFTGTVTLPALKVIRKTATESVNNSTTLQNDDDLLFSMAASEVWAVKIVLRIYSSAVADFKFGIVLPSGEASGFVWGFDNAGTFTAQVISETSTPAMKGAGAWGIQAVIEFIVANGGTLGNFQLQWAQNTAEVSETYVAANSYLIANRLSPA